MFLGDHGYDKAIYRIDSDISVLCQKIHTKLPDTNINELFINKK